MPSPRCFTSRPPKRLRQRRTRESWARTSSVARRSPRRVVMAVEIDDVGEKDGAMAGIQGRLPCRPAAQGRGCGPGTPPPPRARPPRPETRQIRAPRGARVRRLLVGCIHEAEDVAPRLVEPVGQKLHSVAVLDLDILLVRVGKIRSCRSLQIMPVHEDRHARPPVARPAVGRELVKHPWLGWLVVRVAAKPAHRLAQHALELGIFLCQPVDDLTLMADRQQGFPSPSKKWTGSTLLVIGRAPCVSRGACRNASGQVTMKSRRPTSLRLRRGSH